MNVLDTVKRMLLCYPDLFKDRMECLMFLFTVNGNGYDWVDGELVDSDRHSLSKRKSAKLKNEKKEIIAFSKGSYIMDDNQEAYRPILDRIRLETRQYNNHLKFVRENIDLVASVNDTFNLSYSIYPLCQYSCITTIPENIKEDWKEAAISIAKYIRYKEVTDHKTANAPNNLIWVNKVLEDLGAIKKEKERNKLVKKIIKKIKKEKAI